MRYAVYTFRAYSLKLKCEAWVRATYQISAGPPGLERRFLVHFIELGIAGPLWFSPMPGRAAPQAASNLRAA
jgi:hypothetical protein